MASFRTLLLLCWVCLTPTRVLATPLNDTGIDIFRTPTGDVGADLANSPDYIFYPGLTSQDAQYGRDAAAYRGQLIKSGGSAGTTSGHPNGFDFSKISAQGDVLPAESTLGAGPFEWACTLDHHTGLMWEVKVNDPSHLRHLGHTYTWLSPNSRRGTANGGVCLAPDRCDTAKFIHDVNAATLCGHADWRLPTHLELNNLVDRGRLKPAIDPVYFPNSPSNEFWSSTPGAGMPYGVWATDFMTGAAGLSVDFEPRSVRLVRTHRSSLTH